MPVRWRAEADNTDGVEVEVRADPATGEVVGQERDWLRGSAIALQPIAMQARGGSTAPGFSCPNGYRAGTVHRKIVLSPTSTVCSGSQSPMRKAWLTMRVPGASSPSSRGRSFSLRLSSR